VPAGTPVVDAVGNPVGLGVGVAVGEGVAVGDGVAVGEGVAVGDGVAVGVGVADGSTRLNVLLCEAVRLRLSVTFSVTCRSPAGPVYVKLTPAPVPISSVEAASPWTHT
jgi:class 3 adenylate cyclase